MLRALVVVAFSLPVIAFAQGTEPAPADPAAPPTAPPAEAGAPAVPEAPVPDQAQPPPEEPPPVVEPSKFPAGLRFMLSDLTILRVNPIGIETRARVGLQKKLFPSTKKITENNFWFVGVFPKLNPASAHLGVGGEIQPASIFNLRVFGEVQKYFGSFGYLQSFVSPTSNYSDQTLADNKDTTGMTEPQSATVTHFSMQPMLQLKFGKIALRALFLIDYWDFKVRDGDTAAYEATFDTLLPDKGWSISTDTDLLYVTGTGLAAGLRHSWVHPIYASKHFVNPADEMMYDGENNHQRLGFFGAYTLKDKGPSTFNKPTVIVIASWYLTHKYRAGDKTIPGHDADDFRTRAFPYFLAGFAIESDFLAVR